MCISKKVVFFLIMVLVFSLNSCTVSGQSFKTRFDEGKNGLQYRDEAIGYATSSHSLQTFINRFNEGKSGLQYRDEAIGYATSKHSP